MPGADRALPTRTRERAAAFEEFDFSQLFGGRGSEGFADIFRQFSGGRAQGRRAAPERGSDLQHELEIPFRMSITGGEVALHVRRPSGKTEAITVKIPAGIEDGKKIRLRGQGEPAARGAKPGDLLITVRVAPHPCFRRRGNDLEVLVPVTLAEAALGAKIDVPTPQGTITLTVPPGTSGGRRLRVKGRGVATAKGSAGDLYAELRIVLPKEIDEETARQIRAFDATLPDQPASRSAMVAQVTWFVVATVGALLGQAQSMQIHASATRGARQDHWRADPAGHRRRRPRHAHVAGTAYRTPKPASLGGSFPSALVEGAR